MPSNNQYRYWAYTHDAEGDLAADLGNFESLESAIEAVTDELRLMFPDYDQMKYAGRVVDSRENETTIWFAGPVSILQPNGNS